MSAVQEMDSEKRLARRHSERVCAALAEVLPSDHFLVTTGGMGHEGIIVVCLDWEPVLCQPEWYFDNTFGGDDGYTDHLRVYFTTENGVCIDDHDAADKPAIDADPITLAKFIVTVVTAGPPT